MLPTSKIQALGLLLAVAVAGFAAGAATASWAGEDHPGPRDRGRWSYSGRLKEELGLSDPQRDSIRLILRAHRPRARAVMDLVRPQMDSLRGELREEIRAVLTSAQRAAYDSLITRERAERARMDSTHAPERHE